MSRLARLVAFETRQFLQDKMGLFWTFLFPFVLLVVLMGFYGNLGSAGSYAVSVKACLSEEEYSAFSRHIERHYDSIIDLQALSSAILTDGDLYLISQEHCHAHQIGSAQTESKNYQYSILNNSAYPQMTAVVRDAVSTWISPTNSIFTANIYEPNTSDNDGVLDSDQYLTSGIIAMTLTSICLFGITLWIVQMRSANVLNKYRLFPVSSIQLVVTFVLSRAVFMGVYVIVFALAALIIFNVDFNRSSVVLLLGFSLLGVFCFIALGVMLAGLFKSASAAAGVVNLVYLFLTFPSNLFMPEQFFPSLVRTTVEFFPVKAFVEGFRSIAFDASTGYPMSQSVLVLLVWLVVSVVIAAKTFKWSGE